MRRPTVRPAPVLQLFYILSSFLFRGIFVRSFLNNFTQRGKPCPTSITCCVLLDLAAAPTAGFAALAALLSPLFTFAFALTLAFNLTPSQAVAQSADPKVNWSQIETPHFIVIFDSKQNQLGRQYAEFAEQAFAAITPSFGTWPEKTVVLIDDGTDFANGMATGIPYPMMTTYPVLPSSLDSISDYGNWGLELLTHEYTHILTFEPANGVFRPVRWIFGNIVRPNILLPRWYLEGLAVEMETRFSKFGRLRSPNYLAIPRAMIEENKLAFEDISRINETSIPDWPGGIRPYLMGSLLWNEITRRGGDKMIGELNRVYSRRIPFLIDGPLEDRLGVGYSQLLSEIYEKAAQDARQQVAFIQSAGNFSGTKLKQSGYFSHSPVVSPDGRKLLYIGKSHNIDSFVAIVDRSTSAERSFLDVSLNEKSSRTTTTGDGITRASWFRNSSAFVYDAIEVVDRYYQFSDLWRYDLPSTEKEKGRKTKLTTGLRAREPAVAPDDRAIVFVQNVAGSTKLGSILSDGSGYRELLSPPLQTRVARPEFITNSLLAFTEKRDDGAEYLKLARLQRGPDGGITIEGEPQIILKDFAPIHYPRLTSEGLLFVSDRSGAANLYLANKELTDARAVSNTTTRIMTGEIDSTTGDLLYGRLDADGSKMYLTPREGWKKIPSRVPQVSSLVDGQWPTFEAPKVSTKIEIEDYQPLAHLWPRYWLPYAFLIPDGVYLQASTSAQDPLARHAYSLAASYDSLSNKPGLFGQYTNRSTSVPLIFSGEDYYEYLYSSGLTRHTTSGSLTGSFFLPELSNSWRGGLSWQYLQTQFPTIYGEEALVRNGVRASVGWSNASRKGFEISPESGGSFSLAYTRYLPELGNIDYEQTDLSASWFFSRWLPERHALAFFTNASIAPRLNRAILGRSTVGGVYQSGLIQTGFVMRGYGSGVFLGRSLISSTAEYRFPISYVYQGSGTKPFFVQRLHADVFVDALTLDGIAFDSSSKTYRPESLGKFFVGTGAEIKADATIFYHVPVQFTFGLYYGADRNVNANGLFPFIGLGL